MPPDPRPSAGGARAAHGATAAAPGGPGANADPCPPCGLTNTVKATAALLGVSATTVYRLVRADAIPYKRVGRRILVPCAELKVWLASDGRATAARTRGRG